MVAPTKAETLTLLLGVFVAVAADAAAPVLNTEGIQISADLQESQLRDDVHVLTGNVRITQADMLMEADKATVSGLEADRSRAVFERDVHIHSAKADLRADTADATFRNGQIAQATVKGAPASFEQLNATADKKVTGRANQIDYDFAKGTVKLSQNVWFSYGGNEFTGDVVVYSLNDERVVVNPGGTSSGSGRVNITIRPGSGVKLPGTQSAPKPAATPEPTEKKE